MGQQSWLNGEEEQYWKEYNGEDKEVIVQLMRTGRVNAKS